MINKVSIEKIFDYLDGTAIAMFEENNKPYFEGLNEAFNYLLDDELDEVYNSELVDKINALKTPVLSIEFSPEEVRKAVQLCLLRGYKHTNQTNALITPDTIGIFIAYLVKKLFVNKEIKTILDPLVGTGNLLYTVINHIEKDVKAFGIDNEMIKCKLARNLGDMMDIENEIFFQDSLSYYDYGFDLIVTDVDKDFDADYFPYKVINHHIEALKDGAYMIAIIDNDFFEQEKSDIFKQEITKKSNIFGLIKLSETLFTNTPKSILILKKKEKNNSETKDFLLVDLPSFNDIEKFNKSINQMDLWFSKREDVL